MALCSIARPPIAQQTRADRLRAARLRYSQAAVEDVNYRAQRQLNKALFQQLATCRWLAEKRNLLVGGKCELDKHPCIEGLPATARITRACRASSLSSN
jgi:hypothetical protein